MTYMEALAWAHRRIARKPLRAVSLWSSTSSKGHVVLCPMMQALGEKESGRSDGSRQSVGRGYFIWGSQRLEEKEVLLALKRS